MRIFLSGIFLLTTFYLFGSEKQKAEAYLLSNEEYLGSPLYLQLEVIAEENTPPQWPEKIDLPEGLHFYKSFSEKVVPYENSLQLYSKTYIIVATDSGKFFVPPVNIILKGKKSAVISTDSVEIKAGKVHVDENEKAMEPLMPLEVKSGIPLLYQWLIVLAFAIVFLSVLLWIILKNRQPKNLIPKGEDPFLWTLQTLEAARHSLPWNSSKQFHNLNNILRSYMAIQLPDATLPLTGSELLNLTENKYPALNPKLFNWLNTLDKIRFASYSADEELQNNLISEAVEIVKFIHATFQNGGSHG